MLNRLRVVSSYGNHSMRVTAAFGLGARTPPVHAVGCDLTKHETVVLYGLLRGLKKVWEAARSQGKDWIYIDNGYINSGHYDGYYSVTVNALQHSGEGRFDRGEERFRKLRMKWELEPMKSGGRHILILPPTFVFGRCVGIDADDWIRDTTTKLQKCTDRSIVVRRKPKSLLADGKRAVVRTTLLEDLEHCHAVVTYNSKAAIECIVRGYCVVTSTKNCAYGVAADDLTLIDRPFYSLDRQRWLHTLAANQFTLDEMKSGYCLEVLRKDLESGAVPHLPPDEKLTHFFA